MNNKELQAETTAQQSDAAELLPSAPLAANPVLAVRCSTSSKQHLLICNAAFLECCQSMV